MYFIRLFNKTVNIQFSFLARINYSQAFKSLKLDPKIIIELVANAVDLDISTDSATTSNNSISFYLEKFNAKVRVAAMATLLTAFQVLEKRIVISYWHSFIGASSTSSHDLNLIWSLKHDHSPKVRLIAFNTLAVYLECVKAFFTIAAADDASSANLSATNNVSTSGNASFLPISYTIAALIRQLHRDLLSSLNRESFSFIQVQALKCLNCLIKATPYAKLKPGLVYKLITSLNFFLGVRSSSKQATKQVN